jgi:asparagine synthase (glutamine-hydrolysing)
LPIANFQLKSKWRLRLLYFDRQLAIGNRQSGKMCGIAGILGRIDDRNQSALRRMGTAMAHRGPDGEQTWVSPPDPDGTGCLFLHRRLAILDLTDFAAQPMIDPVRHHAIVFNGEIYNYVDIRDELTQAGEKFESTGDTAVLLRALALGRAKAVEKLRGMFAFGLWNPESRQLTLARDPLGIKPLYVCTNPDPAGNWRLAFASEVRALLASGLIDSPALDPASVASVIWNGFVMGPNTIVRGIEQLWPGQVAVYDHLGKQISTEDSWHFPTSANGSPCAENELRQALELSVKEHLISDVPLGVFLSGGVDSSAIANLAQRVSQSPVNTFTLTFDESQYDEGPIAKNVAEKIGAKHHESRLTEEKFRANLEAALDSLDQPSFDGINSYYVSRAVKEAGLTVALSGAGGDELFGGYESFRQLPRLLKFMNRARYAPPVVREAGAQLVDVFAGRSRGVIRPQTRWAKLPDMIRRGADMIGLYQKVYSLFRDDFRRQLLIRPATPPDGLPPSLRKRLAAEIANRSPLAAVSVLEQRCFLGERLLRDTDAASMAVSIETRLPLVDRVLVETITRIPDAQRFLPPRRKQMLRNIGLQGLDPAMFERPKSGFVLPFDKWIRRGLTKTIADTLLARDLCRSVGLNTDTVARLWHAFQSGQRGLYWSRVWAIYMLLRWCDRHGVKLAES